MTETHRYEGRRALVVGGTHGIGLAAAEEQARGGTQIVVTGRDARRARAAAAALGAAGTGVDAGIAESATEAAVRAFSRSHAAELVTRAVRVDTVAPGLIDTPTPGVPGASDAEGAEVEHSGRALTPMARLGTAAEVARAAVFLAPEAAFTTASELQVDGGFSEIVVPA